MKNDGRVITAFALFLMVSLVAATTVQTAAALQPQIQILCTFPDYGGGPSGNLVQGPDGSFYGSAQGVINNGTLFCAAPDGSLSTLFFFYWATTGADPWSKLSFGTDGSLYGTTAEGGAYDLGTLFKITTNGVLTTLVHLNGTNGSGPMGGMCLGQDGNFYGTTRNGGRGGCGTVYRLTPDGIFSTVASFANTNGARPQGDLIQGKDGNFYGTTCYGGVYDDGTVFKLTAHGKLTTLVNFTGPNGSSPNGALLLGPDGNFYGTTTDGGAATAPNAAGTIFKMSPKGDLTTLYNFITSDYGSSRPDGAFPYAGLILGREGSLYGTTLTGGSNSSYGVLYRLDLPPAIISQPASRFKAESTMVSFSVAAVGTKPFSYQWLKDGTALSDGTNISGSQSNVLTLSNLQLSDSGDYSVIVTNVAGSATSSAAELIVLKHGHSAVQTLAANVPDPSGQTNQSGVGPQPLLATPPVNVLTLEGSPNYSYVVQYTTDLLNGSWQILSTNTADTNGTCVVVDPSPTDSQRFYRCVSQ